MTSKESKAWEQIAEETQRSVLEKIPPAWLLSPDLKRGTDVTKIPRECGILSARQLEITEFTATELLVKLHNRTLRAVEVIEAFCARAAIAHQLVNCLSAFFPDEALQEARRLDDILKRTGKLVGPLHGLPIAIKDTYSLRGHAATFGYVGNKDAVVDYDSAVPGILRNAGAVFYVRTLMPQTGMALETNSNLFGRTLNPFNTKLGAGGSSGGDGALVALRGSPIAPSTDIGGSIRIPAAVNGLYGIRPTGDRVPKTGMQSVDAGQLSIKVSCGPVCHSMADLKLLTRLITSSAETRYDPTAVPMPWIEPGGRGRKLVLGVMSSDGVVQPHPPLRRALEEAASSLRSAGHEVIPFEVPFDCWECSQIAFKLYWQNGDVDIRRKLALSGEPLIPVVQEILKSYKVQPQSAAEILQCHRTMAHYKRLFRHAWDDTAKRTTSGRPIDVLICPTAPAVGIPHDFNIWWGYTAMFNVLDYPSTVLPLRKMRVDVDMDRKDDGYRPSSENPFDLPNHEMYNPKLFENQTICIQLVGRPFDDESLLETTDMVDKVLN